MEKPKVLFVQQEITPYLKESQMGLIGRRLPQGILERGKEIRTFMPKYGSINERRNQLHEVIRLSGMNLVINDTDHPLIIKVASISAARMQIYFIDNEDFFSRKFTLSDKAGKCFADNDERAIFFARGVIETVKKLGWSPDVIHCNGWFTSLMPLYIKAVVKDNPMFSDTKVVYSIYNDDFDESLNAALPKKIICKDLDKEAVSLLSNPTFVNLSKVAIHYSDAVIIGSPEINPEVAEFARQSNKPLLEYHPTETYIEAFNEFYDEILMKEPVVSQ
ncbi:MAG TPA: glycogen synthase [Bacteroidales bacterium]|nr:glycogen synthase [Bacteroidales bacterium]